MPESASVIECDNANKASHSFKHRYFKHERRRPERATVIAKFFFIVHALPHSTASLHAMALFAAPRRFAQRLHDAAASRVLRLRTAARS